MESEDFIANAQWVLVGATPVLCALLAAQVFWRRVQRPGLLILVSSAFLYLLYISIIFLPPLLELSHPNFERVGPPVVGANSVTTEELVSGVRYWILRAFIRPMIILAILAIPLVWAIQRFLFKARQTNA